MDEFRKVLIDGRPMWEGRGVLMPVFAGGDGNDDPPQPDPKPNDDPPQPDPKDPPKTFTQEDVDRILSDRLKREREKTKDYDDLKAKAEELDRIKDEEKTELEREKEAREAAEKEAAEKDARANGRLIKAEAKVQAVALNVKSDRIDYVLKLAKDDLSEVSVDDDGEVDTKAVKEAIEKVLKDLPELKGGKKKPSADGGAHREEDDPPTKDPKERLEAIKARTGIT